MPKTKTNQQVLLSTFKLLKKVSTSPRLDAEILLSLALKSTREFLYTYPEHELNSKELTRFNQLTTRRLKSEPIAYITGKKEFFGLDFFVNKNTLIPRPETEIMVEQVIQEIKKIKNKQITLVDIGTGSGCIPISILKNLNTQKAPPFQGGVGVVKIPSANIKLQTFALDISPLALKVAKINAEQHQIIDQIQFIKSNLLSVFLKNQIISTGAKHPIGCLAPLSRLKSQSLFEQLSNQHLFITANLPYLSAKRYQTLAKDVKKFEPKNALIAGTDGLKYYKQLLVQLKTLSKLIKLLSLTLFIEIDPEQERPIKKILSKDFKYAQMQTIKDLADKKRVMIIQS